MTKHIAVLALAAIAGSLCVADSRHKEDFRYNFTLVSGRIDLSSFNGSVEIIGWDNNTVEVTGAKYAAEIGDLGRIQVEAVQEGSTLRIRANRPDRNSGVKCNNCGANFVIRAPRKTELTSIGTSNGSIRAESFDGPAKFGTSNGSIKLLQIKGRVEARTSNGSVDLQSIDGTVTVTTSNGAITLDNVRGSLQAKTSNGSIRGRLVDTVNNEPIHLSTTNGAIDLKIEAQHSNDITASSTNGSVTLRLPESANARINATTSNHESITTDFAVQVRGILSKNRLEGAIGNGSGPMVRVETSNGSIKLLRL